ncbi:MAG: cytochrome c [Planctomycetota bacterium]
MKFSALCVTLVLAIMAFGLAGCRGDRSDKPPRQFFPDMDDQPRFNPQSETSFYEDGRTMRRPVAGTVAFGYTPVISDADWNDEYNRERQQMLDNDSRMSLGQTEEGEYLTTIPVTVDPALLERGESRFNIFCAVCHGYEGEGALQRNTATGDPGSGGMVGRRWSYPVPSLLQDQYRADGDKGQDGYLYTVIRNGVWRPDGSNAMPGYAHALDERDAWAVVAHMRVLQAAAATDINEIEDEAAQQDLLRRRVRPAPVPEAAADGAAEQERAS